MNSCKASKRYLAPRKHDGSCFANGETKVQRSQVFAQGDHSVTGRAGI